MLMMGMKKLNPHRLVATVFFRQRSDISIGYSYIVTGPLAIAPLCFLWAQYIPVTLKLPFETFICPC